MENLITTINRALRARGWSARHASLEAVGSPELIRNMRRGRLPSVDRLQALCDVLDIELYVGPRRKPAAIDERRLEEAVESTERTLEAHSIALDPQAKAHAIAAVYELLDQESSPATAARTKRFIDALTSGRRREPRERKTSPPRREAER